MEEDIIFINSTDIEIIDASEYVTDVNSCFHNLPKVAQPLAQKANKAFARIEQILYSAPAFINLLKASIPEQTLQAILTDEQKAQIVSGALKLMTKKDGTLMANLVNPETKKIVSTVSLQNVDISPDFSQAVTGFSTQMQMAQIAEQIQIVQIAIEEVRQGQESDRLATAYSCQQKLLQAMEIRNPQLKPIALMRIAMDAEDSRNLLMQSQTANLAFIIEQPESFIGKMISGSKPEKIKQRMTEIRESLSAVNMVSLTEAMAYQEMGEDAAATQSLQYYADYIQRTYLDTSGLVERLDLIDPAPQSYWSKTLPDIKRKIHALPCVKDKLLMEGDDNNG